MTHLPLTDRCQVRGCPQAATVHVGFGEFSGVGASLCDRHKPTVEQALRRGTVAKYWKVDGYYPHEIAKCLTSLTGHTIRESTVIADLKWLGLTEARRNAEARLTFDLSGDHTDTNVVPMNRRKQA